MNNVFIAFFVAFGFFSGVSTVKATRVCFTELYFLCKLLLMLLETSLPKCLSTSSFIFLWLDYSRSNLFGVVLELFITDSLHKEIPHEAQLKGQSLAESPFCQVQEAARNEYLE